MAAGHEHSDATKALFREQQTGKTKSAETRAKISASRRGGMPPHGTTARYKGSAARPSCRCDKCRAAWSERNRQQRIARVPI